MDNNQDYQQQNNQPPVQQFNGGFVPPAKPKKPIYKKWWFWVIVAFLLIVVIGAFGGSEDSYETTAPATTEIVEEEPTKSEVSTNYDSSTEEGKIEGVIIDRISNKFDEDTQIEKITINKNLGTDKKGDYIALVYLTWNRENTADTSKEVLKMYSSDLAATVGKETDNVQEIAIFWTVPYHSNSTSKCAYERKDGNMYEMDTMWGF